MTCPQCHNVITTVPVPVIGSFTWIFAVLCCFFGCCCVPFLFDTFKDVEHMCPHCGALVGVYKRI